MTELMKNAEKFSHYRVFLIHAGTNDVANLASPSEILQDVKKLINFVFSLKKGVQVIISSILPRPVDFVDSNPTVLSVNALLRNLAQLTDGVKYIVSYRPFIVNRQPVPHMFSPNCRLHPSWVGTACLRRIFAQVLLPHRLTTKQVAQLESSKQVREGVCDVCEPAMDDVLDQSCPGSARKATSPGSKVRVDPSAASHRSTPYKMRNSRQQEHNSSRDIVFIKGEHDPASNFWSEEFWYGGIRYISAEQCYQCQKAIVNLCPPAKYRTIKRLSHPKDIKREGGTILENARWFMIRTTLMKDILLAKLGQSPAYRRRLGASGSARLVHNVSSPFWGTGENGQGHNMFGIISTDVRQLYYQGATGAHGCR